jgi:hypothetical protein
VSVFSLREGAPALDDLPRTACARPHEYPVRGSVEELKRTCRNRNEELLGTLREDKHAQYLLDQTLADAECGRMTKPVGADELNLDDVLLG